MPSTRNHGRFVFVLATLLVAGAGCDLGAVVRLRSPFDFGGPAEAPKPYALSVGSGASFTIQPSALGVGGTVSQLLGSKEGARSVTVDKYGPEKLAVTWSDLESASGTPASGTIETVNWSTSHAMLPPAFWKPGNAQIEGSGLLWLSPEAYSELMAGKPTEWRTALGGSKLSALAAKTLSTFESIAAKLSKQSSATATSPFVIKKAAYIASYPIRVNGRIEHVEAFRASGWFAELLVLKNPATPLIMNVTVHPSAFAALKALEPVGGDPASFGYEVTEVETK